MDLSDFRPIRLIGSMYNILAKVLASRFKKIIPVVVGEVQSAFIFGRNIQDGIRIANKVEWLDKRVSTARVSVLVNGFPGQQFQMRKGVRQGDSMSPFLFILAAEGLNWLPKSAKLLGSFSGLKMGVDGPMVAHLQFADGTLVFCQPKLEEVVSVKNGSKSKGDTVTPPPKKSVKQMMGESVKSSANKYKNKPKISPGAGSA
ncbi:uncharacterized protein LOC130775950 [Actinidia eriantha]|uniref:uncharacterized protein LOC130775950 n=1 Tax=Actinidia eriantha TaxID=165200 RepID=UPI00258C86B7|nr:uncharacterized protein LOC130775950 [Actinidia eriantha]